MSLGKAASDRPDAIKRRFLDVFTPTLLVKMFATLALFILNFIKGLVFSIPGPTLLSLAHTSKTTIGQLSWIFFFRGCGTVAGSILGGVTSQYRTIILCLCTIVTSLTFGALPFCHDIITLDILFVIHAMSYGNLSVAMNYFIFQLWEDSAAIFTAMVSCFLTGATVGPVIAIPFLPGTDHDDTFPAGNHGTILACNNTQTNASLLLLMNDNAKELGELVNVSSANVSFLGTQPDTVTKKTQQLYCIILLCGICSAFIATFASLMCTRVNLAMHKLSDSQGNESFVDCKKTRPVLIIFCLLYQVFLIGMEILFVSLIASYMVKGLGCSPRIGTLITSLFWGTYTAVAILGVGVAHYLTPSTILLSNNVLLTVAVITLFCANSSLMVWIGTVLLAIGFGPTCAVSFLWGKSFVTLTRKLTGVFVAAPDVGEIIVPVIAGQFFTENPSSLMLIMLILCISCDALFILTEAIALPFHRKLGQWAFGWRKKEGYESLT